MAPLSSRRLRSASADTTVRFWVVTLSPPMRPAMRVPLNTRAGVAHWPMEPGARCTRWAPWLARWPENPWRFMAPAKPLPLETAVTSMRSPSTSSATVSSWPIS